MLWVLGGVTCLLLYRVVTGPPGRSGLVVIENIRAESLEHRSLDVDGPVRMVARGVGSFENDSDVLAAYGWIIDRSTREVVWSMDASSGVKRGRGLLAEVMDTLILEGGQFEVFFAAYGSRHAGAGRPRSLFDRIGGGPDWRNEARKWYLVLDRLNGDSAVARSVTRHVEEAAQTPGEHVLWRSGPLSNEETATFYFEVKADTPILVRCIGELGEDEPRDYGHIENALTHETVWELDRVHSVHAGGIEANRMFTGTLSLSPGIYLASYRTDGSHAYGRWRGNPPYDPFNWGLTLALDAPSNAILAFDPWAGRTPVIQVMPARSDQFEAVTFAVSRPVRVAVYAAGEMKPSSRYDYGWLERAPVGPDDAVEDPADREPDPSSTVWEMKYADTQPAGGSSYNRRTLAFLDLNPDTYTLFYRTDDSHAYDDWRHGAPDEAERWGVALFALDAPAESFRILHHISLIRTDRRHDDAAPPPPPPAAPVPLPVREDQILVALNRLGNNASRRATLILAEATPVRIIAAGEISLSGNRYDYGDIRRASDGAIVWEMTRENTRPAGGDDANRIFDDVIELPAGEYVVHFQTDATHAYGAFDTGAPAMPDAWGITIARVP